MNRRIFSFLATLALSTQVSSFAQQAARLPVIVVFNDGVNFQGFAASYRPDQRAAADPPAWGYLDRGVAGAVQGLERGNGFQADHVFSHSIRGFSASLTARQIQDLENNPMVQNIEPDGTMSIVAQTLPWGIDRIDADTSTTAAGNGSGAVSNVNVYIIDTGIDTRHGDLNVVKHVNFAGGPNSDCHGHGTHVAGTVAAIDNASDVVGVAPGARLTGVKVLGCGGTGTNSGVIKGIDYVTANAVKPAIANMSLGGGASNAVDNAVRASVAQGVFYSIAAGNSGANACNSSPARAGAGADNGIMTTAATDSADQEASFSNYGSCVDIWAPGVSVLSTKKGGGTTTFSGTSMAAPHVGGSGALYLSSKPAASPALVESMLKNTATSTSKKSKDGRTITVVSVATF
jgi:subtilisin family serine protease